MTNNFLTRHRAVRTLLFILATSLAGFASVIGTFDRSFQVNGAVNLEVLTRSGDITVRNGSAGGIKKPSRPPRNGFKTPLSLWERGRG